MAKMYEIAFQLAGKLGSNFHSTFMTAQNQLKNVDGQIKKLTANQGKVTRFDSLKRELISTEKQFQAAQAKVKALAIEMKAAESPTKAMEKAFSKAKDEAGKLKGKLSDQQKELSRTRAEMKEAGVSTTQLAEHHRRLGTEMDRLRAKRVVYADLNAAAGKFKASAVSAFKGVAIAAGACTAAVTGYYATAMGLANNVMSTATQARAGIKLGFGAEGFQELSYAAKMSGIDIDSFNGCMNKMVVSLAKAKDGSKKGLGAELNKIGLSAKDLNAMGPDKAIMKITEALKGVADPAERTRIAVGLFGKEGLKMMPMLKQGAGGIQNLRDEAKRLGLVLSEETVKQAGEYGKMKKRMGTVFEGAKLTVGSAIMPALTGGMEELMKVIATNRGDIQAFAVTFANGLKTAIPYTIQFIKEVKNISQSVIDVVKHSSVLMFAMNHLGYVLASIVAYKTGMAFISMGKNAISAGRDIMAFGNAVKTLATSTKLWSAAQGALNVVMSIGRGLLSATKMVAYYAVVGTIRLATGLWAAAQAGLNVVMSMNPIGLVILGIAGLIAIGYLLVTNWEIIKTFFINMWNDPASAFDGFVSGIKNKFSGIMDWFKNQAAWLKNMFSGGSASAGGEGGDGMGSSLPGHATGGIFNREHIARFAEGNKPEAIIPLNKSPQSLALLQQVNQRMGVNQQPTGFAAIEPSTAHNKSQSSSGHTFIYSPNINAGNASAQELKPVLEQDKSSFEQQMNAWTSQQERVSYA